MGLIDKIIGGNGNDGVDQLEARKERARMRGRMERRREFREKQLEKEQARGRRKALTLGERVQDVATKAGEKIANEAKNFDAPDTGDFDGGGRGSGFLDDDTSAGEAFLDDSPSKGNDDILDF